MGIEESKCDYFGAVGDDQRGKDAKELCAEAGVTTHFCKVQDRPTGTCAVVVVNKERTLTTNLGAAEAYTE